MPEREPPLLPPNRQPSAWRQWRVRIGLVGLVPLMTLFLLTAWGGQWVLERTARANLQAQAEQAERLLRPALQGWLQRPAASPPPPLQAWLTPDQGLDYLWLTSDEGQTLARSDAVPNPPPAPSPSLRDGWRDGTWHRQVELRVGDRVVQLRYGLSTAPWRHAWWWWQGSQWLALAASLALAVAGLRRLWRAWHRRMQGLAQAGAQMAAGDFERPAPDHEGDELDPLGRQLNSMADVVRTRIAMISENEARIRRLADELEYRVQQRTAELQASNQELAQTLDNLRRLQISAVQSDNLASLGALVAAVAHELNTPIGNALTVATTFRTKARSFNEQARTRLQRQTLDNFLTDTEDATELLQRNLDKASELITSFKHVAMDQTSAQRRRFDLADTIRDVLATMAPSLRQRPIRIETDLTPGISMDSYPGALGQVLTNCYNNALLHAFAPEQAGTLRVSAQRSTDDQVEIEFRDNGAGMDLDTLRRVFDPFFTTRLGQGGSGLGMHIVHNLVVGPLQGRIEVRSTPGQGTAVHLWLPVRVADNAADPTVALATTA